MLRIAITALALAFAVSGVRAADTAAPAAAPAANAPVVQPDKIPGNWKIEPQPLPPLDEILKRPAATLPVYGLYTWAEGYRKNRESLKQVGWRVFRLGGPFEDDDMKMFAEDGVEVMVCPSNPSKKNYKDFDSDEAFIAAYLKSIDEFLTRYGPGGTFFKDNPAAPQRPILHCEIWNEPNFHYMIPDDKSKTRGEINAQRDALYAKVLPAVYDAIKRKWPTVQVVGFGAGGASKDDIRFIGNVFAKDPAHIAKSFDILSTHPYQNTPPDTYDVRAWGQYSVASSLRAIREIMTQGGAAGKPVWYTECGWPISKADGGEYEMDGKEETTTPLLQAAYIVRMYALAMRLGVERVHIMHVRDIHGYNAGFFLNNGSWRPSAFAVQTIVKLMPNPKIKKAVSDGVDGYYAYECQADGLAKESPQGLVIMAWNVAGPKTVEITVPTPKAQVVDMLGHEKTVAAKDGKITVEVGPCPVYVRALGLE